jgi:3-deoxy-7-phosphoheptulonate synthase
VEEDMELRYVGSEKPNIVVDMGDDVRFGDGNFTVIAGPCSIENREQMEIIAKSLQQNGVKVLRGGAFKPRTSPYSFQGLGKAGVEIMAEVAKKYNLKTVTEVMDPRDVAWLSQRVDMLQIGSRNMQNFALLTEVGKAKKPVMLKRGMTSTIEEWLFAAEYIAKEGNLDIILCERGIRTFENHTRNTLDLTIVPIIKKLSNLPIIVDPSHGTGKRDLVIPMTKAAHIIGADGVMVEMHPKPEIALSDGEQSLKLEDMDELVRVVKYLDEIFRGR